jgi:hypothetical protein
VFGHGRDDWNAGERLYPPSRDDLGAPEIDYAPGHASAPRDTWQNDSGSRGNGEETASAFVRPYAVTGGRTRPRYQLQIEAMVAASHYEARDSVAEISAVLRMPLGVARVLIADMAMEGLVRVHQLDHAQGRPDINLLERVLSGLRKL